VGGSRRSQHAEILRPITPLENAGSNDGRPRGVLAVAIVFFLASAYLLVLGLIKLINPEAIPLSLGAPLLHGLVIYGPYMFLLAGGFGLITSYGLFRLKNLARRAAIVVTVAGIVLLIPKVSADAAEFSADFFLAGSMIVVRIMIAWYLWQGWTAEKFS
jgi:hypothetical protein